MIDWTNTMNTMTMITMTGRKLTTNWVTNSGLLSPYYHPAYYAHDVILFSVPTVSECLAFAVICRKSFFVVACLLLFRTNRRKTALNCHCSWVCFVFIFNLLALFRSLLVCEFVPAFFDLSLFLSTPHGHIPILLLIKIETLFNLRSSSSLWNSFFAPIAFSSFSLSRGDTEELIGLTPQLKAQGRAGLFFLFLLSKKKGWKSKEDIDNIRFDTGAEEGINVRFGVINVINVINVSNDRNGYIKQYIYPS